MCVNVKINLSLGSPWFCSRSHCTYSQECVPQLVKLSAYGGFRAVLHTFVLISVVGHNLLESKDDIVHILHSNQYLLNRYLLVDKLSK